jgi:hypothetical protein
VAPDPLKHQKLLIANSIVNYDRFLEGRNADDL